MVQIHIDDLEIFFPYSFVYPEQYDYMKYLKKTLDAKGHCVLEMPTGTGKTVALLSLVTSYQLVNPQMGKLIYCTRTVPEMEKVLDELKVIIEYREQERRESVHRNVLPNLLQDASRQTTLQDDHSCDTVRRGQFLGMGMASRRNLCIHPQICQEAHREKIDEKCQNLIAPWIRRKRRVILQSQEPHEASLHSIRLVKNEQSTRPTMVSSCNISHSEDIEEGGCVSNCHAPSASTPGISESFSGEPPPSCCPYYENFDTLFSPLLLPSGIYTLGAMKTFCRNWVNGTTKKPAAICPYFASRRAIHFANVVVFSYQYVLDPRVSQVAFMANSGLAGSASSHPPMGFTKSSDIVVFDEAHNIDNVCIDAFSVNLNLMILEKSRQNIEHLKSLVKRAMSINASQLNEEYERLVKNLREEAHLDDEDLKHLGPLVLPVETLKEAIPGTIRRAELFLMNLEKLLYFLSAYIRVFTVKAEGPLSFLKRVKDETSISSLTLQFCSERLRSLLNTLEVTSYDEFSSLSLVADFFTLLGHYWEGFILITDPYPEAEGIYDPVIQLSCLDSSLAMKRVFQHFQSVILTSGTISPLFLYPKLLGFSPVVVKSLSMSLDRDCICPLIVVKGADQVPLSSKFILRSDAAVMRNFGTLLEELSKTIPDGIVCFFPSYAFMEQIVASWYRTGVLAEVLRHKLILMETKDVVATTLALQSYRKACDCGRGAVFFSVARGKVSEGIDFDRHYGRAVVLFGIPYQYTLSRMLKARLEFLREAHQIPENEFLTFDAMRQAAQCVGRIIRSKTDYGLMIFADSRYTSVGKREKLPEWILRHLDGAHVALSTDAALSIARRFLLDMAQPLVLTSKSRFDPSVHAFPNEPKSVENGSLT